MVTRAPAKPAIAATKKPVAAATVRKTRAVAKPAVKAAPVASKKPLAVKKASTAKPVTAVPKTTPIAPTAAAPKVISAKPAISVKPAAEQKVKVKKTKLVRDSFTMPEDEYQVLSDVKKACLKAGLAVKKSELLRVGVALLRDLDNAKLKAAIAGLPLVKAGRPQKDK